MTTLRSDIAIIGTGPAGLITALSVASKGFDVALIGRRPVTDPARPDTRTIALWEPSIELLKNIGAWEACAPHGTALRAIRIVDDTGNLIRAPEILFDAKDIEHEAFGYNIPNEHLIPALFECTQALTNVTFVETEGVVKVMPGKDQVEITLKEGEIHTTRLLAAADGRNSIARASAGIDVKRWSYPQTAVVCNFEHSTSHDNISTEFHRKAGPFTTVPMADTGVDGDSAGAVHRSSLVWVETPTEANRIKALNDAGYILEIQKRLQGLLGDVTAIGPRASFPLSGMTAKQYAKNRVALVGETAHVVPPIGAQGLNLSFRDAAHLADCVDGNNKDPGMQSVLDTYHDARRSDVEGRAWGIDLLNRALISKHYPMQIMRGFGLHMLSAMPALKHAAMREGMKSGDSLPNLMRGQ